MACALLLEKVLRGVAILEKNLAAVTGLALTDGSAPSLGIQVFTMDHFKDAVNLAVSGDAPLQAEEQKLRANDDFRAAPERPAVIENSLHSQPAPVARPSRPCRSG